MDPRKVGNLILQLRKEKGLTQKQLAEQMHISDKTVSKWERGLGCPDVSLLCILSELLSADIERLLQGDLSPNNTDGGNMKKIKFYVCQDCGNIITATGQGEICCCGRKLMPLSPQKADGCHCAAAEEIEYDLYVTFNHEMTKTHYISFAAVVSFDRVLLIRLYPEQNPQIRFPRLPRAKLYYYCTNHGLYEL